MEKNYFLSNEQVSALLTIRAYDGLEISNRRVVKNTEFNRVFYVVYEGKLREMVFVKQFVFPFNRAYNMNGTKVSTFFLINISGVGYKYVFPYQYYFPFNIYESVRDFKEGNVYYLRTELLSIPQYKKIYNGICDINLGMKPLCYKWNGTSAETVKVELPLYFTIDSNGYNVPLEEKDYPNKIDDSLYASKSLCEEENQIELYTFDDEQKENLKVKKEEPKRYDINIFGVPMTATKEELSDIRKQINQILL